MPASFSTTYTQFLNELKDTFPEFLPALVAASELPDAQAQFTALWHPYTTDVAAKNASIFTADGISLVPGVTMTASLWSELSSATQNAMWKYISSLLLLAATDDDSLWDLSGFKTSLSTMMAHMTSASADLSGALPEGFASLFEKLSSMGAGLPNLGAGFPDLSGALPNFKIPERLFKGHIAKIAEELVKEFKPEDFGINPELLESKDPARVFTYLQEVFTKKPEMLMNAAQKIGKKLQAKFARGDINRDEIIREAEELMKEFSDNDAFSSLFGSLGEMFKGSEPEGSPSARRREVQERLRKKAAEKKARAEGVTTNTVTYSDASIAAAAAATAELLKEEEAKSASTKFILKKKR
jgi:hypothetical protein